MSIHVDPKQKIGNYADPELTGSKEQSVQGLQSLFSRISGPIFEVI